jgi:non-specific protein-tyrosine kinase
LLWRWAWAIALAALLAGAAAYILARRVPHTYEASATLFVYQAPASSGTADYTEILTSERMVRSYVRALQARPILEEAIARLNLDIDSATLAEHLSVREIRETQLIVVTVEDADARRAANLANQIVDIFVQQHFTLIASLYADSKHELETELAAIEQQIDDAQQRLEDLGDVRTFQEQAEYDRTQMLLWQYQNRYSLVFHSLENVRMAEAQSTDLVHVIEPAVPPTRSTAPPARLLAVLAAMAGGFAAVVAVTLADYLDQKIRTAAQPGQLLGCPALAPVERRKPRADTPLLAPGSEAYSMLAVQLGLLREQQPFQTLLVASSLPGEGRSTIAANLAAALARAGQRVVLVDADLRRPTLHRWFDIINIQGLATLLAGNRHTLDGCVMPTRIPGLYLLPGGPPPPHPAALLQSPRMVHILDQLQGPVDVVVLDSPALLPNADATLLAHLADATLLVAQAGTTTGPDLLQSRERLRQAGATLVGAVLNQAAPAHTRRMRQQRRRATTVLESQPAPARHSSEAASRHTPAHPVAEGG